MSLALGFYDGFLPHREEKRMNTVIKEAVFQLNIRNKNRNKACLVPWGNILRLLNSMDPTYLKEFEQELSAKKEFFASCAMIHYMYTKGVYHVNKTLMDSIYDEEILRKCPSDIFLRIPQYTIFVDLSESEGKPFGAFFYAAYTTAEDDSKISLITMLVNDKRYNVSILPIIKGLPFSEAHLAAGGTADKNLGTFKGSHGIGVELAIQKALSVLMYICSQEPDIELLQIQKEADKKTKPSNQENPLKLRPAAKQKDWVVGQNISKLIASFHKESGDLKRSGVIPHIRKAHWHGYWKGARDSDREFILKWLAPIIVKGSKDD